MLEQLDQIAGEVGEQDLAAAGPGNQLAAERQANATESVDLGVQVVDEPGGHPARAGQTGRRRPAMA